MSNELRQIACRIYVFINLQLRVSAYTYLLVFILLSVLNVSQFRTCIYCNDDDNEVTMFYYRNMVVGRSSKNSIRLAVALDKKQFNM